MIKALILAIVIVGLAVAGLAVKIFLTKEGTLKKSCSSIDPSTGKKIGCTCGGQESGASCDNKND